jgi:hypothetical protein
MWAKKFVDWHPSAQCCPAGQTQAPLLARFVGKLVLDVLPAVLASVIGAFLFTQYQIGRATAPQPAAERISPASAEVLALVRDEHDAIVGYLKTQLAAEKSRLAAQDAETARATADARAAQEKAAQEKTALDNEAREKVLAELGAMETKLAAAAPTRRTVAGSAPIVQAKGALPRSKPAAAPASAPVVIAQAGPQAEPQAESQAEPTKAAPAPERLARDPDSLLAKTLDLKDQVVAATRNAVAAIGDVFSSVGEHIGGGSNARPFSSDS